MERYGSAAVRNNEPQRREVLEQIALDELHEGRGVRVDIVRTGGVKYRVTGRADVHHGGHIQLHHLFVERIPVAVSERRRSPVAPRRIGIQVAADETELVYAALQLLDAIFGRNAGRLRQLAHADEVTRVQRADAVNQIVALLRPVQAGGRVANMMRHGRSARRKNGDIRAALALQLELRAFQAFADLVVADVDGALGTRLRWIFERRKLGIAIVLKRLGRGGVVAVTIDNHEPSN